MLTVFCWSYVDVIPSDGQVRLPAERQGPSMCDELAAGLCAVCLLSPLLQSGQAHEMGGGETKGRCSFSLNGQGRPAEEREMDLLQMPPWVH